MFNKLKEWFDKVAPKVMYVCLMVASIALCFGAAVWTIKFALRMLGVL